MSTPYRRGQVTWEPCPDCTPLDNGEPSGVQLTCKDAE